MSMLGSRLILIWQIGLILFVAGCGGSNIPVGDSGPNAQPPDDLVPAKGVITLDGKPQAGIRVVLMDPDMMKKVVAAKGYANGPSDITNDNGEFAITTTKKGDGAVAGTYKVFFEWFPEGSANHFDDPTVPVSSAVAAKLPPGVMDFYKKYRAGGAGNQDLTLESGQPQTDLKYDLTTK